MKSLLQTLVRATVAAGLCLAAGLTATAQDDTAGIVRISKPSTAAVTQAGWHGSNYNAGGSCMNGSGCPSGNCQFGNSQYGNCPTGNCPYGCPHGGLFGCKHGCYGGPWVTGLYGSCGCNGCGGCCGRDMANYFRCKFGYFIPSGAGGAGVPLAGKYARVYPQDPYYFDQRDGMAWAAQGYGMPMAVPLAPVVGHTYNYSWGTPASRLTPVSRPAY